MTTYLKTRMKCHYPVCSQFLPKCFKAVIDLLTMDPPRI